MLLTVKSLYMVMPCHFALYLLVTCYSLDLLLLGPYMVMHYSLELCILFCLYHVHNRIHYLIY